MIVATDRALVVSIVLALSAGTAAAQAPSPADAAFTRGRELLKAGKYADACIEFEHSNKLDPQLGTQFNIAQCSEQVGKLARALELYRALLANDANAQRKAVVAAAIPKLEARVPKLVVAVANKPAGLLVTVRPIQTVVPPRTLDVNAPVEMDLGEYTLVARATGVPDWTRNLRIAEEGETTTVELPASIAPAPEVEPPTTTGTPSSTGTDDEDEDEDAEPAPTKSRRKLLAIGALATGGVALIGGAVFGSMANTKWTEAKDVCGGTTCGTQADLDRANALRDTASGRATLSTVFFVAGGVAVAGGIVLWLTAPSEHEVRVSAAPSADGGGFLVSGRF